MVRSIVASCDRSYKHLWHPVCDRSYYHSWHPMTERTINRGVQRSIARSIVALCDRSLRPTTDRAIHHDNRGTKRPIVRSIVASCERSYDQYCNYLSAIIHNWSCHHARSRKTYLRRLTIWNRRLQVFNMTIDLVASDLPFAITHDLCDQSYVLSTICLRFQIVLIIIIIIIIIIITLFRH